MALKKSVVVLCWGLFCRLRQCMNRLLTQKVLAELFGVKVPAIHKHLKNIFESRELVEASVISILETTAADGKSYQTRCYNLDAIIAVGYRVNSRSEERRVGKECRS